MISGRCPNPDNPCPHARPPAPDQRGRGRDRPDDPDDPVLRRSRTPCTGRPVRWRLPAVRRVRPRSPAVHPRPARRRRLLAGADPPAPRGRSGAGAEPCAAARHDRPGRAPPVPPRGGGADPAPGRIARRQGGTAGDHDRRGAGPAGSRPRPPGRPGGRPRRDGRRDAPMNGTGTNAGLHAIAGETRDRYRWIVLGVTSVGALLAALTSGTLVIALPADPARPPHGPVQPDLDRRRLHAGGDRPRPERRPDRGPGRASPLLHRRLRPVHDRLGRVRPGPERRCC